jgi:hypothetical protein
VTKDAGSHLARAALGAATGAPIGAAVSAATSDKGKRGRGALRGAAGGGLLGAAAGDVTKVGSIKRALAGMPKSAVGERALESAKRVAESTGSGSRAIGHVMGEGPYPGTSPYVRGEIKRAAGAGAAGGAVGGALARKKKSVED